MGKLVINKLIVVEGKYDKIRLENIVDAKIIAVNGFGIFNNERMRASVKSLARNGAIILTDSDTAGYRIRVFINSILSGCEVYNVFLPQIAGTEPRKTKPSAQGFLGVEGISDKEITERLSEFADGVPAPRADITSADLYELGLTGASGAFERRNALLKKMGVQSNISAKFLLRLINERYTRAEFEDLLKSI